MRRHARVKKIMTAAIVTGAVTWAMPTVAAQAPQPELPAASSIEVSAVEVPVEVPAVPAPQPVEVASAEPLASLELASWVVSSAMAWVTG